MGILERYAKGPEVTELELLAEIVDWLEKIRYTLRYIFAGVWLLIPINIWAAGYVATRKI